MSPRPPELDPLFFPERIGIAGFSERSGTWGRATYEHLRRAGFEGEVVAVRPRHRPNGLRAVDGLDEAGPLDILLLAIPGPAAVELVAEAATSSVRSAIVFSDGFAEDGPAGRLLQDQLVGAAGDLPVLGPNCLGVVSAPGRTVLANSAFLQRDRLTGPVGLVTQSGAVGFLLADHLRRRGIGFSYYASTGNEAVLGVPDLLAWYAERTDLRVIGCYLENLRDGSAWRAACRRAHDRGVSVVVLRVGTSVGGMRAALSHTAAAAGDAELFEAVCREEGVVVVDDEVAFADAVCSLHRAVRVPSRPRVAVLSMSGGAGALAADRLSEVGDIHELAPATRSALDALGIALAGTTNPVDLTGMFVRHLDRLDEVVDILAGDPGTDAVVAIFTFGDRLVEVYRSLIGHLAELAVPAWFVWAGAPSGEIERLAGTGMVTDNIPGVVRLIGAQLSASRPGAPPPREAGAHVPLPANDGVITERAAAPLLRAAGLPVVSTWTATTVEEVMARVPADEAPFVLKIDHPAAPHRARLGLVRVDVDSEDLAGVASGLLDLAARHGLASPTLVVQPLISSVAAFSLGALRHPTYGQMVVAGAGGSRVESTEGPRHAACVPLSGSGRQTLIDTALGVTGGRGDPVAVGRALDAVAQVLDGHAEVTEIDVNPVLITQSDGLIAVDSLIITHPPDQADP